MIGKNLNQKIHDQIKFLELNKCNTCGSTNHATEPHLLTAQAVELTKEGPKRINSGSVFVALYCRDCSVTRLLLIDNLVQNYQQYL